MSSHESDFKQAIADRIKSRLKDINLSRLEFAELSKVQPSIVTRWLSGTHNFTSDTLARIESVLNFKILHTYMESELNLKKTTAHVVVASTDERSSGIAGYYSNYTAAAINTKGVGCYGSDGNVETRTVYTDGDQIYEVKCLGKFKDVSEKERQEMVDRIKAKLTPEEWAFYQQNENQP
jgi:transcriptional regulator with XRE-family HTH domain